MKKVLVHSIEFLRFNIVWDGVDNVSHYITTRQNNEIKSNYDGFNMCDYTGDDPGNVEMCRNIFSEINGIQTDALFFPRQVHGEDILIVDSKDTARELITQNTYDAIITSLKGVCIGVSTADCVPIILYDKNKKVIAAIHAGWRGTVKHIVSKTVKKMVEHYGSEPKDIIAGIGPAISKKNFEVGAEVPVEFKNAGYDIKHIEESVVSGKYVIDLWNANKQDLIEAGIIEANIEIAGICTVDNYETLFSARKLGINSGRITTCLLMS